MCVTSAHPQMIYFDHNATTPLHPVARDAWLAANTEVALKFAAAIKQAAIWANGHQKASAVLLTKFTNLDPAVADKMGRATYATAA